MATEGLRRVWVWARIQHGPQLTDGVSNTFVSICGLFKKENSDGSGCRKSAMLDLLTVRNAECCGGFRGRCTSSFRLCYHSACVVSSWDAVRQLGSIAEGEYPAVRIN